MFDSNRVFSEIGIEGFKKILDCMQECVWVGDENERTVYANPNFCKLLGYGLEEMLGEESYIFWDEESTRTVQSNNQLRVKGEASQYEGNLKAKDGTIIPVFLSGTPLPNGGTVGIITDLRELKTLKRIEEDLTELNKQKDDFISLVSHELRTPMTAIKGYLSMILDGDMGKISKDAHHAVDLSYESTLRLIDLVNDMLDLTKIESGSMTFSIEKERIEPILKEVYQSMRVLAEQKGLWLLLEESEGVSESYVLADANKLKQVLINLVNNALKFTPQGGTVTLRCSSPDADTVSFEVSDTGIGIPKDKQERIFDKFFQVENYTKRQEEGLGLGLALSSNIIREHGSSIRVESEPGMGAKFSFKLPMFASFR